MSAKEAPKKLALGITSHMEAAKQLADEQNIPTFSTPRNGPAVITKAPPPAAPEPTSAPQPTASVTALHPATAAPQPKKARGPQPSPTKRFSVDLPLYVFDQLHNLVHKTRLDKKELILKALSEGGFDIKEVDIYRKGHANG
jgi:hypothetical protein